MARREFNGPQRAVDAMMRGEDPNKDRLKKGAEYGMAAKPPARMVTPREAYNKLRRKVSSMF